MILSTLNHLVHVLESSSYLLCMVYQHWYVALMNESWKTLFQFYRRILDRGWLSGFPEIPTTQQSSKLSCNGEFFKCCLYKTCCKCPPSSAPAKAWAFMMIDCIKLCLLWPQQTCLIYITLGSTPSSRKRLEDTSAYKRHHFSGEKCCESPLHACSRVR